jgi:hypothetical protein
VKKFQQASGEAAILRAYELAELARKQCDAAHDAVRRHRETHGCRNPAQIYLKPWVSSAQEAEEAPRWASSISWRLG